jgi:hypothetical protein
MPISASTSAFPWREQSMGLAMGRTAQRMVAIPAPLDSLLQSSLGQLKCRSFLIQDFEIRIKKAFDQLKLGHGVS